MKVSYKKLWVMLAEREISKATLRKQAGLSSATFTKLRKNQEVTLAVMLKIADVLNCNAGDMIFTSTVTTNPRNHIFKIQFLNYLYH